MSDRKEWIDIARGIAITLVVIGHSLQTFHLVLGYHPDPLLDTVIYSFHMPFFFLLSGYLFGYKNILKRKFTSVCLTNFQRLVLPCFGTIFIILLYQYFITSKIMNIDIGASFIKKLVIVSLYGSGKLLQFSEMTDMTSLVWFLLCLCAANQIFWLIMKATEKRNAMIRGAIIIMTSYLGVFIGEHTVSLPWSLDIALASQIFLYAGYVINTVNPAGKKAGLHLSIILISLSVTVLSIRMGGISLNEREYHHFVISASGGIAGSILLLYFSKLLGRLSSPFNAAAFSSFTSVIRNVISAVSWAGKEALIIYCLHVLDFTFLGWFYFQSGLLKLIFTNWAVLVLFRFFYCIIMIDMIRRIPFIRSLFYWKEFPISIPGRRSAPDFS